MENTKINWLDYTMFVGWLRRRLRYERPGTARRDSVITARDALLGLLPICQKDMERLQSSYIPPKKPREFNVDLLMS